MKKAAAYLRLTFATAIVLFLASCEFRGVEGSGNVTTENRPVTGDFTSIDASHGLDIIVEQSDKLSITVEADDNVQPHIKTKIENGVLIITSNINSYSNATKTITVQLPVIHNLEVSSGASLKSRNTLKSKAIYVKSSSGSEADVTIEAEKATCETSSGGNINIDGKAISLEAAASSGSVLDAERLLSNDVIASGSSGSSIDVHPLLSLNADASSGSNINYHNTPKSLKKNANSGGNISQE